ncbi:MAG: Uma2 family endonuclease [Pyrinomonadaceae bacterium]|nr:Uma2 family endonuclease [Pyrinomonadaceae bacterium]
MKAFKQIYSLEEYIELEKSSEEKFEFWDGNVWSMAGASPSHNRIVRNLLTEIDAQLRIKGCESFPSDMRIKVPAYPPYRYPDLTALCGEAEFENLSGQDLLVNPQLIVEVLSESTEAFDRGDKFSYYKSIKSFTEYLLVAQHRPHVSQFIKHGDGFWINLEFNDLTEIVELKSVPCKLSLSDIYRNVSFPANLSESETEKSKE